MRKGERMVGCLSVKPAESRAGRAGEEGSEDEGPPADCRRAGGLYPVTRGRRRQPARAPACLTAGHVWRMSAGTKQRLLRKLMS